jgi:hypothetical protein
MSSALMAGSALRSRYLPSRFSSAFALSALSRPPGGAQEPVRPGHRGDLPPQLGPFHRRELVRSGDELFQRGDHLRADRGVADGLVRVEADDEPVPGVREPDFLDLQVPGDGLVAALP